MPTTFPKVTLVLKNSVTNLPRWSFCYLGNVVNRKWSSYWWRKPCLNSILSIVSTVVNTWRTSRLAASQIVNLKMKKKTINCQPDDIPNLKRFYAYWQEDFTLINQLHLKYNSTSPSDDMNRSKYSFNVNQEVIQDFICLFSNKVRYSVTIVIDTKFIHYPFLRLLSTDSMVRKRKILLVDNVWWPGSAGRGQ